MSAFHPQKRRSSQRTAPDVSKLMDLNAGASASNGLRPDESGLGAAAAEIETTLDLNEITRRQLREDITAYRYDLEFTQAQAAQPDLSPEEQRATNLRILDIGHMVRHCQQRLEVIEAQMRQPAAQPARHVYHPQFPQFPRAQNNGSSITVAPPAKRQRVAKNELNDDDSVMVAAPRSPGARTPPAEGLGRLGYWECRLCTSTTYLRAGPNRTPNMPCKWPLKDVSKMLNHFLDMHAEQPSEERCKELGDALDVNRGPLEYWLTRTRHMNVGDGAIMDNIIGTLQKGQLPDVLRSLNRAAAVFPNGPRSPRREESSVVAEDEE